MDGWFLRPCTSHLATRLLKHLSVNCAWSLLTSQSGTSSRAGATSNVSLAGRFGHLKRQFCDKLDEVRTTACLSRRRGATKPGHLADEVSDVRRVGTPLAVPVEMTPAQRVYMPVHSTILTRWLAP